MMYTINRFRPRAARHWSILGLVVISSISVLAFSEANAAEPDDYRWSAAPSEAQLNALTIRDAILRAFSRNPQIAQAAAQIEVGQANLSAAESALVSTGFFAGGAGRSHQTDSAGSLNNNGSVGMNLQQLLYDFGKTSGSIDEQNNLTAAYTYQMYSTMNAVGQQTLQNYLQVKRYQELAQASMRNLLSLQKVRDMAQMRADAGLSSQSDVLQASSRIAAMNATYEQYQSQVRSSQAALAALTGAISDNLPDVPQSLLKQEMKQTLSYQQNNAVRSAQAKQQAAAQRVEQAKAQRWPTVSVQAGRTRYSYNTGNYWDDQIQLVVNAPIYQGGALNAKIDAAEGERRAAQAEVEANKLDINQKAATAYADMYGAGQRQMAGKAQQTSAEQTRGVYQDEYKLSKRSLNDLLSVEQDVMQADVAEIGARYDAWDAAVRYAGAADNLLDMLGIVRHKAEDDALPAL